MRQSGMWQRGEMWRSAPKGAGLLVCGIWRLCSAQPRTLPDMPDTRASYCMEGKVLLGSADGPSKVWDIAASSPVPLPDLEGHAAVVWCVKASASLALSCSADETAWLWDLRTSRCVRTMEGHTGAVWSATWTGTAAQLSAAPPTRRSSYGISVAGVVLKHVRATPATCEMC